jgi:hypothetical protein
MLPAVDMHEFAKAVAPPRLVDGFALLAIAPQPVSDHPQPQCLATEHDPMNLTQLLDRQSRTKTQYHSRMIASTASAASVVNRL